MTIYIYIYIYIYIFDHLVRASIDREGRSKPCHGANCSSEVCNSVKDTSKFKKAGSEEIFNILKGPLDCNSHNVVYFLNANVGLNSLR